MRTLTQEQCLELGDFFADEANGMREAEKTDRTAGNEAAALRASGAASALFQASNAFLRRAIELGQVAA